jgi:hypothetical protein
VRLLAQTTSVVPRNVYRRSLVRPPFSRRRQAFSDRGSGPQGLRRPRFSFFRFTCQTARRSWRSPSPVNRRAAEAHDFRPRSEVWHTIGEELRRRVIAPKADGAPLWGLYSLRPQTLSTPQARSFPATQARPARLRNRHRAALGPHSSVVVSHRGKASGRRSNQLMLQACALTRQTGATSFRRPLEGASGWRCHAARWARRCA